MLADVRRGKAVGKNNKARRAAKAKDRARRGTPRSRGEQWHQGPDDPFAASPEQVAAALWLELERAVRTDLPDARDLAERLAGLPSHHADGFAETLLLDLVAQLWGFGWQPAEVRRHVRRHTTAASTRLVELAMIVDHDRRPGQGLDPRWAAQLRELSQQEVSTQGRWMSQWQRHEATGRVEAYLAVARIICVLTSVPPLDVLIPPPGAARWSAALGVPEGAAGDDDPMLRRIRGLLAKAESTEFEEEASALTAKAQELMTRHAIGRAKVDADDERDVPRLTRIPIDSPYSDAKSMLLGAVADANRCRAVYLTGLDMSTVAGHAGDLQVVELMFTSLLVQAQNSLAHAARVTEMGRRARSQSFRSSFFVAYAHRIRERLDGVNHDVVTGAGADALPVLRAREAAVDEFIDAHFGDSLRTGGVRGGYDYAGHAFGRQAADAAKLDAGELLW
jgi:hypothetical protein